MRYTHISLSLSLSHTHKGWFQFETFKHVNSTWWEWVIRMIINESDNCQTLKARSKTTHTNRILLTVPDGNTLFTVSRRDGYRRIAPDGTRYGSTLWLQRRKMWQKRPDTFLDGIRRERSVWETMSSANLFEFSRNKTSEMEMRIGNSWPLNNWWNNY